MDFKEKLNEYIEQLGCTSKELAQASGLSAATISRYRSGDRLPQWDSENYNKLIAGLSGLAQEKCISSLTESAISETLSIFSENTFVDIHRLQTNFNYLLNTLSLNVSELSRALNYDASYISRIRNGQRKPADPQEFATKITDFVTHKYQDVSQKSQIAALIGCDADAFKDPDIYRTSLFHWLTDQTQPSKNYMADFLKKLEQFDLNEYIRAIHFDEMKVPTAPFQFPTSRSYYGLKEMMDSELAFLKATVLSKSVEPVAMYSDMPMGEMAKDPEFPKKWMFGMAMMLKKGLHLNQIHNLDRSFEDMMLGLESWIPMYMTGQISPYYLKGSPGNIFSHFLKVSGTAALSGEAICGYHSEGRYYLTKKQRRSCTLPQTRGQTSLQGISAYEDLPSGTGTGLPEFPSAERTYARRAALYSLFSVTLHNDRWASGTDSGSQPVNTGRTGSDHRLCTIFQRFFRRAPGSQPGYRRNTTPDRRGICKISDDFISFRYVSGKRCLLYMGRISDSSTSAARIPRKTSSVPRKAKFLACLPQHSDLYSSREICHGI